MGVNEKLSSILGTRAQFGPAPIRFAELEQVVRTSAGHGESRTDDDRQHVGMLDVLVTNDLDGRVLSINPEETGKILGALGQESAMPDPLSAEYVSRAYTGYGRICRVHRAGEHQY